MSSLWDLVKEHNEKERNTIISLCLDFGDDYSFRSLRSPFTRRIVEFSASKHVFAGIIKVLEATLEMEMHSENHTLESTALLHELYNGMGKFGFE
ncbi:hypothetical protein Tco_1263846 [Tanacetum coccineum]